MPCPSVFFIRRCFRRQKNQQVHKKLSNERHNEFVQLHGLVQLFLMILFGQWIPLAGGVGQNFTCSCYCLLPAVLVQFFHHFPTHWALWQGSSLNVMPRNIWSKAGLKCEPLSLNKIFRYPYLSMYEQTFLQSYLCAENYCISCLLCQRNSCALVNMSVFELQFWSSPGMMRYYFSLPLPPVFPWSGLWLVYKLLHAFFTRDRW